MPLSCFWLTDQPTGLWQSYLERSAPVTIVLVALVVLVFAAEVALTIRGSVARVEILATGLFVIHPVGAWTFAPLLHRGVMHFVASIGGLLLLGIPIEQHWAWKRYAVFLVVAGYGSIAGGAAVLWLFSDQQVAFYGTSGVVYALAGFGLTHLVRQHGNEQPVDYVILVIGVVALLQVMLDLLTGPYLTPHSFNGGHLTGFLIGVVCGASRSSRCGD